MTAKGKTCIHPDRDTQVVIPRHWAKEGNNAWFSAFTGGFKIKYPSETQLAFLKLLSTKAEQKFTYFCMNAVAWYNQEKDDYKQSLRIMGANEHEFKRIKQRDVIYDGCRNRRSNAYTVFEIKTKRVQQLPIIDFAPRDYGQSWQKFGFEMGPVCYS